MTTELTTYTLDEVCEFTNGFAFKSKDYIPESDETVEVFRMGYIERGGGFKEDTTPVFIPREYGRDLSKFMLRPGDVTIAMTDMKNNVAILGNTARVTHADRFVLNQRVGCIRVSRRDVLDPRFFYYYSNSADHIQDLRSRANSGVQVNLSTAAIKESELHLPPLPEQRAIASILGALDDKIELNRRMNATLESLARAIFNSWFVDFAPVKINAGQMPASSQALATHDPKVLDLFPSTFQDSELGPIPEGWQYHSLPDVTTFREGPGILAKDFHDEGVPLIRLAGLKNDVSLLAGCNFLDPAKVEKKWSHFRLENGDVLLSTSASLGRVAEVNDEAVGAIPYTGLIGFRPIESKTNRRYIRHYLTSSHFQAQVEAMGVGSVLKHFGPTHLKQMKMLVPPLGIQEEFKHAVAKMDEMTSKNLLQSAKLAANRDTLLPRLLSGELPVPGAMTRAEEALA